MKDLVNIFKFLKAINLYTLNNKTKAETKKFLPFKIIFCLLIMFVYYEAKL